MSGTAPFHFIVRQSRMLLQTTQKVHTTNYKNTDYSKSISLYYLLI